MPNAVNVAECVSAPAALLALSLITLLVPTWLAIDPSLPFSIVISKSLLSPIVNPASAKRITLSKDPVELSTKSLAKFPPSLNALDAVP